MVETTVVEHNGISNVTGDLTPGEKRHMVSLEKRIERGMTTFREVGEALAEIRDQRLYRETHATFDAYCRERWSFDRGRAYQLIGAAEVARALPEGFRGITNEAQARELVPLARENPELVADVWKTIASGDAPISASRIRQAVRSHISKPVGAGAPLSPATRLVGLFNKTTEEYKHWLESKPSRTEREMVREAAGRLTEALK